MTIRSPQTILFATIGLPDIEKHDPVYFTIRKFRPDKIYLFSSDEDGPEDPNRQVVALAKDIKKENLKVNVCTKYTPLNQFDLEMNSLSIAKSIIRELTEDPTKKIVFDVTGGRVAISYALNYAGWMALEYLHKIEGIKNINIECAIKPKGISEIVTFMLKPAGVPNKQEFEVLNLIDENDTQNIIADNLSRALDEDKLDQSTISRYLNSLLKNGYVDRVKGKFMKTPKGEMLLEIDEELY